MIQKRKSGPELLRILAMLAIVAHHYAVHGGFEALSVDHLQGGTLFVQFLSLFGKPACSLFALISGYFLVTSNDRMRTHYKKLGYLCGTILMYKILGLIVAVVMGAPVNRRFVLTSFMPLHNTNWYVLYYIALYMLAPLINPLFRSLRRRRFMQLNLLLIVIWSLLPSMRIATPLFAGPWSFSSLDFFLVMYSIGAYLRLHVHGKVHYRNRWNLAIAAAATLTILLCVFAVDFLALRLHSDGILGRVKVIWEKDFILFVIWAIALVLFFSNLDFQSGAINRIASTTLGVYLLHDHPFFRALIWQRISPNGNYQTAPYLHALVKIPLVFAACVAIELLRAATIGRWFNRWFSRTYDRCFAKLDARRARKSLRAG